MPISLWLWLWQKNKVQCPSYSWRKNDQKWSKNGNQGGQVGAVTTRRWSSYLLYCSLFSLSREIFMESAYLHSLLHSNEVHVNDWRSFYNEIYIFSKIETNLCVWNYSKFYRVPHCLNVNLNDQKKSHFYWCNPGMLGTYMIPPKKGFLKSRGRFLRYSYLSTKMVVIWSGLPLHQFQKKLAVNG